MGDSARIASVPDLCATQSWIPHVSTAGTEMGSSSRVKMRWPAALAPALNVVIEKMPMMETASSHGHSPTTRVKQNRTRRIAWVRLQEPNVQDCGKDRLCKKCRILKFAELSALQKGIALSEDGDTFVQCHECSSGTLASLLPRRTRRTFFQVVGVMAKVENQNLQHFSRPGTACHSDRKPLAGRYERRAGSKGANNATVLSNVATNAKVAHRTTAVCVTT